LDRDDIPECFELLEVATNGAVAIPAVSRSMASSRSSIFAVGDIEPRRSPYTRLHATACGLAREGSFFPVRAIRLQRGVWLSPGDDNQGRIGVDLTFGSAPIGLHTQIHPALLISHFSCEA
jgi:hypothetical protein